MLVTLNRQVVSISHKEVSLYIFTRHRLKPGDSWEALVRWSPPGPVGSPVVSTRRTSQGGTGSGGGPTATFTGPRDAWQAAPCRGDMCPSVWRLRQGDCHGRTTSHCPQSSPEKEWKEEQLVKHGVLDGV